MEEGLSLRGESQYTTLQAKMNLNSLYQIQATERVNVGGGWPKVQKPKKSLRKLLLYQIQATECLCRWGMTESTET